MNTVFECLVVFNLKGKQVFYQKTALRYRNQPGGAAPSPQDQFSLSLLPAAQIPSRTFAVPDAGAYLAEMDATFPAFLRLPRPWRQPYPHACNTQPETIQICAPMLPSRRRPDVLKLQIKVVDVAGNFCPDPGRWWRMLSGLER